MNSARNPPKIYSTSWAHHPGLVFGCGRLAIHHHGHGHAVGLASHWPGSSLDGGNYPAGAVASFLLLSVILCTIRRRSAREWNGSKKTSKGFDKVSKRSTKTGNRLETKAIRSAFGPPVIGERCGRKEMLARMLDLQPVNGRGMEGTGNNYSPSTLF